VDQVPGANDMPTCLTFATTPDGSTNCTERMRITSAGNVGIGTNSPGAELEVADNNGDNDARINLRANASTISQIGASSTQTFIDSVGARPFVVFTNAVERMRIDASGNVGIGTGTPSSKLHLTSSDTGWPSGLTLENTAASRKFALSTRSDLPSPARFSISDETALAERVSILGSNGNLGIGELNPSSKLHINGDLTMSSATVATSATAGTNGDVPAQVAGYLVVNINGTARKIPYYA
jgi:hypothetical protein